MKIMSLPVVFLALLLTSCREKGADQRQDIVEGTLQMTMGAGHITLVTENQTEYALRLMPDYKYLDNTGKNPPNAKGQMDSILLGPSGKYRCKGTRRTIDEVTKDVRESGRAESFRYSGGTDYFFDVYDIELVEATEK